MLSQLLSVGDKIKAEREKIRAEGEELEREKGHYLDNNITPPSNYDIRLLSFIRKIIQHDQVHRQNLTPDQRKANLANIVKSVMLLTQNGIKSYYNSDPNGLYANANLWDDLAYLSKFKIAKSDPRIIQPYDITSQEINELLEGQCITILNDLCEAENLAYQHENGVAPLPPANSMVQRTQNRAAYRDHRNIQQLYVKVAYYREIEQLDKAIAAMQLAEGVNLGAGAPEPENTINKVTILRAFVVLGEAATKKNLTPHTKALALGLTNNDWQLFIGIRNKLAHAEWDFHRKNLDTYLLANHNFVTLQTELPYIRAQYEQARQSLIALNNGELQAHYTTPAVVIGVAGNLLVNLRALFATLPTAANAQQDRQHHPASFMASTMAERIDTEVKTLEAELRSILPLPVLSALNDTHNEDMHALIDADARSILVELRRVNNRRAVPITELNNDIIAISSYFTNREGGHILLELPPGLVLAYWALANFGMGSSAAITITTHDLQQHLLNRFDDYKNTIAQYKRWLNFVGSLRDEPRLVCICEHRIGRIGKFLAGIPNAQLDPLIGNMPRREMNALRNLVQHGDDAVDIAMIRREEFLLHYLQPIMRRLVSAITPLLPLPVGLPNNAAAPPPALPVGLPNNAAAPPLTLPPVGLPNNAGSSSVLSANQPILFGYQNHPYPALLATFGVRDNKATGPRIATALEKIVRAHGQGIAVETADKFEQWARSHHRRFNARSIHEFKRNNI